MKSYLDLDVWKKSRSLVSEVYSITKSFPDSEKYGLISQMQRCAVSVPSNIAEGHGRKYNKEKTRFILISRGSLFELETQLYLSFDLDYIEEKELNLLIEKITEIKKMTNGLIRFLEG